MKRVLAAAVLTGALISCVAVGEPAATSSAIARAVGNPSRAPKQVETDTYRKPAETLAFAGVAPGMVVGEFFPGGGYFTQMLSDVVGEHGHVYGIENTGWKGAVKADQDLVDEKKLANVSIAGLPFGQVRFPKPLDLVWITQNYHDLKVAKFGVVDTQAFDREVFAALKPGGILFILDHEAPAGTDLEAIAKLHRIERSVVIQEVTKAGFVLIDEGDFLHTSADDHKLSIFDPKVQNHTDQYALKFRKPPERHEA